MRRAKRTPVSDCGCGWRFSFDSACLQAVRSHARGLKYVHPGGISHETGEASARPGVSGRGSRHRGSSPGLCPRRVRRSRPYRRGPADRDSLPGEDRPLWCERPVWPQTKLTPFVGRHWAKNWSGSSRSTVARAGLSEKAGRRSCVGVSKVSSLTRRCLSGIQGSKKTACERHFGLLVFWYFCL